MPRLRTHLPREIIHWNGFSDEQKQATLDRLEKQTYQVVKKYLDITDQNKLTEKLHKHNIKYRSHFHPLYWAHTLLREGADKINKVIFPRFQGHMSFIIKQPFLLV